MQHLEQTCDLVVIGGGPAGLSAGLYAARAGLSCIVAEMSVPGGQIATSESIENYPGIPRSDGYGLGDSLRAHAEEAGCKLIYDEAHDLSVLGDGSFTVAIGNESYRATAVIYAAGAAPRRAGFEGEQMFTGRGVSYCATCDGAFYRNKDVYVIGGGTSACEEALFLARMTKSVNIVVRGSALSTLKPIQDAIRETPNIRVLYNAVIESVGGGSFISTIRLRHTDGSPSETLTYPEGHVGIFVFVGHSPRIDLITPFVDIEHEAIKTDACMRTRTPGLYAAGDVRDTVLRQVVTAVSDGAIAATEANRYIIERNSHR